ncbi:PrgI family protein [Pseudonocardia sp. Cha107L01]|uniref:PrgI family protein n=1 Tax=Pseudonocardia sp. Cha107L01 TaxID=3457576 RepID=UPI00403ED3FF
MDRLNAVAIPADVDLEDKILAGLTTRQVVIFGVTGLVLYLLWSATQHAVGLGAFVVFAVPVAATAVALALGKRDGVSLDRFVAAAVAHRARTRRLAPETDPDPAGHSSVVAGMWEGADPGGVLLRAVRRPVRRPWLPARGVGQAATAGVVDLGPDGLAVLAAVSTVSFALRTPAEQDALVAVFARYLHSLTTPVQVLIRAVPLDVDDLVTDLHQAATDMTHPALADAALDHADYLTELAQSHELLRRHVVLVLREPQPARTPSRDQGSAQVRADRIALTRLARRLTEATELLAPAGITVTGLNAKQTHAVLEEATFPYTPYEPDDPYNTAPAEPADMDRPDKPADEGGDQ